jgi:hypothetical protein
MLFFVLYSLGLLFQLNSANAQQSGEATYFAVGLCVILGYSTQNMALVGLTKFYRGACGGVNVPTDFVSPLPLRLHWGLNIT